jgi:uncharacterized protein YqhQ
MQILNRFLKRPLISRIRRNHGLEHATIHVLSSRFPSTPIAGRSDSNGFYILGKLNITDVEDATLEALRRLEAGEQHLAVHPNCGTNFLTAGILAGGASYVSLLGGRNSHWRDRLERLPLAIMATVLALILAQPLGTAVQRHITTQADPTGLEIVEIRRYRRGRTTIHRVLTRD